MKELLDYYKDCFELIDKIHFNSDVTRKEYENVLGEGLGEVVYITHGSIADNRAVKSFSESGLVVGFIGNDTPYKGLQVLVEAIEDLDADVMVWGTSAGAGKHASEKGVHYRGTFGKELFTKIYKEMDLMVVPSIWKETFSLVTLEALSFGVPVLVSSNVGAQDVVKEYMPEFVFHSKDELREVLTNLVADKSLLTKYNKRICELPWKHDVKSHAEEVIEKIYKKYRPRSVKDG